MNATFLPQKDCIVGLSPMDDITDMPFRELSEGVYTSSPNSMLLHSSRFYLDKAHKIFEFLC